MTIRIKKKNRGKFTASAKSHGKGVQEYAHEVMSNPNASSTQKKRANFAIQAKKWHHGNNGLDITPIHKPLPSINEPVPQYDVDSLPDYPGYSVIGNQQQPQQPHSEFNYGHAALAGLMGIDALIPPEKVKNPVVRPGLTYNPNQYGASYKAGGKLYKSKSYCSGGKMPDGGQLKHAKLTMHPDMYTPFGAHSQDAMDQGWMPITSQGGKTEYQNRYDSGINQVVIPGDTRKGHISVVGDRNGLFDAYIADADNKPKQYLLKGSNYNDLNTYFTNQRSTVQGRVNSIQQGMNPEGRDESASRELIGAPQMYYGGGIDIDMDNDYINPEEVAKSGHWIQGAVNPKHKGYCTPMTKSTCTPRRKAFAKTMKKHHGFHKDGGTLTPYEPEGTYDLHPNQIKSLLSAGYDLDFK